MTEHGWPKDEWPTIWERVKAADILIDRLCAVSGELNDRGQSIYHNKVSGAVITGSEDGVKPVAMREPMAAALASTTSSRSATQRSGPETACISRR